MTDFAALSQAKKLPGVPLVRALERGIAIMRAFSISQPRLTLTELAKAAELDKGTTRRLLQTLILSDLVDYDEKQSTYSLSVGVLELASAVETGRELREIAAPYLAEAAEKTGATAFLWVHHEGMALCVERVRSSLTNFDATWFRVGARATLNAGGGPRIILSFIDEKDRELALSRPVEARTPISTMNPDTLRQDAASIKERGWELAVDDFIVGLAAVGVPIFDRSNRFVGAMSITNLTPQIVENGKPRHLEFLKQAATTLGGKIF